MVKYDASLYKVGVLTFLLGFQTRYGIHNKYSFWLGEVNRRGNHGHRRETNSFIALESSREIKKLLILLFLLLDHPFLPKSRP